MIIFAGSGLAARWPCRTGIVTRSEACRASRRRPELGGVAAKAAASLAASFPSRTPVSGAQRHCPRSTTGAREGEPQASRCRSRVRVSVSGPQCHCPRSTTGGAGGRAARRVDAVPASAFRQWTPTSLPPVYDRGRGRVSRRRVDAVPASAFPSVDPNVTAPGLRPGGAGGRAARRVDAVPASAFPSVDPNVTAPGLRPGAREGEPQASRCRSRVRVSVSGPQRHCPRSTTGGAGGRAVRRVDAVPASAFAVAASRRSCETFLGCRVRVVCDRARSRCQGRQPRAAGAERSDAP